MPLSSVRGLFCKSPLAMVVPESAFLFVLLNAVNDISTFWWEKFFSSICWHWLVSFSISFKEICTGRVSDRCFSVTLAMSSGLLKKGRIVVKMSTNETKGCQNKRQCIQCRRFLCRMQCKLARSVSKTKVKEVLSDGNISGNRRFRSNPVSTRCSLHRGHQLVVVSQWII